MEVAALVLLLGCFAGIMCSGVVFECQSGCCVTCIVHFKAAPACQNVRFGEQSLHSKVIYRCPSGWFVVFFSRSR